MYRIITFLLCCSLQASLDPETLTYDFFLPSNFKSLLDLTGALVSRNSETLPDLTTLYDDTYKRQLHDFKALGIPDEKLLSVLGETFARIEKGGHRHFTLLSFFEKISERLNNIFSSDMPNIREKHPDILTKSKLEQAEVIHEWYKSKNIILFMEAYGNFIKDHVLFSDDLENRYGRLLINGEEVYRGKPHEE